MCAREDFQEKSAMTDCSARLTEEEKKKFDEVKSWATGSSDWQIVDWIRKYPIEKLRAAKQKTENANPKNFGAYFASLIKKNFPVLTEGVNKCLEFCEQFLKDMLERKISPWKGFTFEDEEFWVEYCVNGNFEKMHFTENFDEFKRSLLHKYDTAMARA